MDINKNIPVKLVEESKSGKVWKVSLLSEGASKNTTNGAPRYYPEELLREVCERFEGIPAYVYKAGEEGFDHLPAKYQEKEGDLLLNKIGWYENPRLETIEGETHIVADLKIHDGAESVSKFLKEAWEKGKRLGASIVADGYAKLKKVQDKTYAVMEDLIPKSVDPVSEPATGAKFLELLESEEVEMELSEGLVKLAEELKPETLESFDGGIPEERALQEDEEQLKFIDKLMESFDAESFQEKLVGNQLGRLREAVFKEQEKKATGILLEMLGEEVSESYLENEGDEQDAPGLEEVSAKLDKIMDSLEEEEESTEQPEDQSLEGMIARLKDFLEEGDLESSREVLSRIETMDGETEDEEEGDMEESSEKVGELEERISSLEMKKAKETFKEKVSEYGIPSPAEKRLRRQLFVEEGSVTEEELEETLEEESDFIDDLIGEVGSQVTGMDLQAVESEERLEESKNILEGFFDSRLRVEREEV